MRRRQFLHFIGGAGAWPSVASAQQQTPKKRIGVMISRPENDPEAMAYVAAFQEGLKAAGRTPGGDIEIDYRWTAGSVSLTQVFAKELVGLKPNVLVINSTAPLQATRQIAGSIPIVMVAIADPVAQGFVKSLIRPGGTITGFGVEEPSMGAKWAELLKEIAPRVAHITAVFNPASAPFARMFLPSIEGLRPSLSFDLAAAPVRSDDEIKAAVAAAARRTASGLIFLPDSFLAARREKIAEVVAGQQLPAIYSTSTFIRSGGLIGYGFDRAELFRQAAGYVERILKGEKPADLPVQMPTKFELSINLKAAKILGLSVPPSLLVRADEVIE